VPLSTSPLFETVSALLMPAKPIIIDDALLQIELSPVTTEVL
jgi:hypothetical protein